MAWRLWDNSLYTQIWGGNASQGPGKGCVRSERYGLEWIEGQGVGGPLGTRRNLWPWLLPWEWRAGGMTSDLGQSSWPSLPPLRYRRTAAQGAVSTDLEDVIQESLLMGPGTCPALIITAETHTLPSQAPQFHMDAPRGSQRSQRPPDSCLLRVSPLQAVPGSLPTPAALCPRRLPSFMYQSPGATVTQASWPGNLPFGQGSAGTWVPGQATRHWTPLGYSVLFPPLKMMMISSTWCPHTHTHTRIFTHLDWGPVCIQQNSLIFFFNFFFSFAKV